MTQQVINIGSAPNDGTGDQLRTAFDKSNDNFAELYAAVPTLQPLDPDLTSIAGYGSTGSWLYRSAADTWTAVTFGTGITFSGGQLSVTAGTYQPLDNELTALAGTTAAADKLPYFTSGSAATTTDLSAYGRSLIDDADAGTAQTTLGISTFVKTILDDADAAAVRATIGAGIGDVTQAGNNSFTGQNYFNLGSNLPLVVGHTARITTTYSMELNGTSAGGTTQHGIANTRWSADTVGAQLMLRKSRGASVGTNTVVSSGDTLGKVSFAGNHGTGFQVGGPAVSGVCNSAPFGTNTPGYVLIEAVTIGGALTSAATFKDTGCAILGTNTNDSAAAGFVGEWATPVSFSSVAFTGTATNVGTLALTAGDWDVWCVFQQLINASTTTDGYANVSISPTSATIDNTLGRGTLQTVLRNNFPASATPMSRFSSASSFNVYAVASATGVASLTATGYLMARRVR